MSKELAILIPIGFTLISIIYLVVCKIRGTGKMIRKIVQAVIAIVLGIVAYQIVVGMIDDNSAKALEACPASIEGITYGDAIESYCSDVTWKQFVDDGTKNIIIEMNGKGDYEGKEHDIKIQFLNADEDDNGRIPDDAAILVRFVGLDDNEETPEETEKDILFTMFSEYALENDIELEEWQKDDILETKAYQEKYGTSSTEEGDPPEVEDEDYDATDSVEDSSEDEQSENSVTFNP